MPSSCSRPPLSSGTQSSTPHRIASSMPENELVVIPKSTHGAPEKEAERDGLTVTLSDIEVISGLASRTTHLEVVVKKMPSQEPEIKTSNPVIKSANPKWFEEDRKATFTGLRPSSTVRLQLFRNRIYIGHLIGHQPIGEYEEYVGNILAGQDDAGVSIDLAPPNSEGQPIRLRFHVTFAYSTPPSIIYFAITDAATRLADARLSLLRSEHGKVTSTISKADDTLAPIVTNAQSIVDDARNLDGEQIIGAMVKALDAVVKIGDAITAAHPMTKVAWTVVTYIYKAAKAEQQVGNDTRELADSLSRMLAYGAACKDVAPIEGRENIVVRAANLTRQGACIIDDRMTHSAIVRTVIGPLSDIKDRIRACLHDIDELQKEFDRTLRIDARNLEVLKGLASANGAGWNAALACMDGTRKDLRQKVSSWIRAERETAGIFLLTAPAGTGKSALAHAVACDAKASSDDVLVVSFFFDRSVADRSHPQLFVSTVVRALAERDGGGQFRSSVIASLRDDRDIQSKRIEEQFSQLLMCHASAFTSRRVLILVDALDECSGYSGDFLTILCEHIPKLPPSFRLLLTSRPEDILIRHLPKYPHVYPTNIELDSDENHSDISAYVYAQREKIASYSELGPSWPTDEQCKALISKAGGLFIWISLVMDFIGKVNLRKRDRKWNLESILSQDVTNLTPTQTMNELYSTVLSAYDWTNKQFVEDYNLVVGAIIAAKEPLSKRSLRALCEDDDDIVDDTLSVLSPLFIIDVDDDDNPVQLLHLTLHEFLTDPLRSKEYFIDEAEQSRSLGLRCLKLLVNSLSKEISGLGWSSSWDQYQYRPIPTIRVPNAVAYSCRFWIDHIADKTDESWDKYLDPLDTFSPCLISWLEVATALGEFPALDRLRSWATMILPLQTSSFGHSLASKEVASSLKTLSNRLRDVGRREEALKASEEAVNIYRQLAKDRPEAFNPDLATSLNNLSNRLNGVGRREEALKASEEAVNIYRQLAKDHPEAFNPDLARSLNNLSIRLYHVGRREDALKAIEEAVNIRRQLARDRPEAFNPDLATSLNNLSNSLSNLGRRERALEGVEEAVNIYRQLAKDRPEAFNPDLAGSLHNLSGRLHDVGRQEDALKAIEEAVNIRRQLVKYRPEAFNPDLAMSLTDLSTSFHDVGHREDAVKAIEEAVNIHRQLARDRPEAFNHALAMSLYNSSIYFSVLRLKEDALRTANESLGLYRLLHSERPIMFQQDLIDALNEVADCLSALDQDEEASQYRGEAEALKAELAPTTVQPDA